MKSSIFETDGLSKTYGLTRALNISSKIKIPRGKLVCVLGHSGSGKSTLLNLLAPYVSFLFATILLLVCLFLITTTWKISLHSSSIAGLCGGIMAEIVAINEVNNSNTIMIINTLLLVLMGLVCFARIYLKAHTFLQVIAGLSLGFSLMFVVVYFQWSI